MAEQPGDRFRVRDGLGIAACGVVLVAALAVILLVMGVWKRFARWTVPALLELPGGSWTVGAVLGVISVLGAFCGVRCAADSPRGTRWGGKFRAACGAVSWAAGIGPCFYLLSSLPGKNCPADESRCVYIAGTGTACLAYVISAAVLGWLVYRWGKAKAVSQAARERERMRRLRKKGRGKSRAARRR